MMNWFKKVMSKNEEGIEVEQTVQVSLEDIVEYQAAVSSMAKPQPSEKEQNLISQKRGY